MNVLAIMNPASGGGKSSSEISTIKRSLGEIADQILLTKYPGHATEIAKLNNNVETIAVAGGDGTLFECLNGMDRFGPQIALVPTGTGNSLAQDLRIRTWETGITNCTLGVMQKIDAIRISYKCKKGRDSQIRCLATTGLGYPANVVALGNNRFKKMKQWCYPVAGFTQSFSQNTIMGKAKIDSVEIDMTGLTGILINNTKYAGNFRAFPDANISDGVFDLLLMTVGPIRQNIQNLMVLMGNYSYMPNLSCQAKEFFIELEVPMPLMVDGEIIPDVVEAGYRIESRSVNCLVPRR